MYQSRPRKKDGPEIDSSAGKIHVCSHCVSSRLLLRSRPDHPLDRCRLLLFCAGLLVCAATAPACQTVDVGPTTGPPEGCAAPPPFFVTDVWPKYFDKYSCGKSSCHDASSGHGYFRLQSVMGIPAPVPTDPTTLWPPQWAFNLESVQANVSCDNPTASIVLIVPSGQSAPHPGGIVVTDLPGANTLFTQWLAP